jgi:hypothetical protein
MHYNGHYTKIDILVQALCVFNAAYLEVERTQDSQCSCVGHYAC